MSTDRPEPPTTEIPDPPTAAAPGIAPTVASALPGPGAAPQPGYPPGWTPAPVPYPGWGYYPPPSPPTDTTAILGLIFAFVFPPAGLVLSIIGMRRTKNTPDRTGYTLALVGMILSAVATATIVLFLLSWLSAMLTFWTSFQTFNV